MDKSYISLCLQHNEKHLEVIGGVQLIIFFNLMHPFGVGDWSKGEVPFKIGFHFAAHKQTDVRHEGITDGERRGQSVGVQV